MVIIVLVVAMSCIIAFLLVPGGKVIVLIFTRNALLATPFISRQQYYTFNLSNKQ